ncbi:MAG: hypothetical protein KJO20_10835 [Eudoraea sp.]|nr:hypothetical protein [Eudoraea sp.]
MIKFFRRIRQQLLTENQFSKYIFYAIGEIILVVIGILIALQINTWNQNRLDSKEETQLLEAIQVKMEYNRFQSETGYNRYHAVLKASTQLIKISTNQITSNNQDEVDYYLHNLSKRFLVGNSNKTSIYDEMIGSGQLNLLKSKALRSELTSLKANLELLASYEDLQTSFVDNYLNPFLNKHADRLPITIKGFEKDTAIYDKILAEPYSTIKMLNRKPTDFNLLTDSEFINLLTELIYHTKALLPVYGRVDENISTIESLISNAGQK